MKKTVAQIAAVIPSLTQDEIRQLSLMLRDQWNHNNRQKSAAVAAQFSRGQKVKWFGKRGNMSGVITKINVKTIIVDAGANGEWRVSPSLLSAA